MKAQLSIEKIIEGDIKEFENLFKSMYPSLCAYAVKFTKNDADAEEIVQEVFFQFWEKRSKLKIRTSLNAYLYKMVNNACLSALRHQVVKDKYEAHVKATDNSFPTPEEGMQAGEFYQIYKNTLNSLPKRCRQIFYMNRNLGLKYSEISNKLSISVKTVEANMGKALKAFRASFAAYNLSE